MPDGGSDCCANCAFNKAVQEMGLSHEWAVSHGDDYEALDKDRERFGRSAYCQLRNVDIPQPGWTYCANIVHGKFEPPPPGEVRIAGPIRRSGLFEGGYARIPWHGDVEPRVSVSCQCALCGRSTERGIVVSDAGEQLGFCSNRHYTEWWNAKHDGNADSERYPSPEEIYATDE